MKGNFKEQIERINRSFEKLPKEHFLEKINEDIRDNFYHFFQDCYHLKDWIKNDPKLDRSVKNDVENFVNNSKSLKLVGDFANATKHLQLTRWKIDEKIDVEIIPVYSGDKKEEMFSVKTINESFGSLSLPLNAIKEML